MLTQDQLNEAMQCYSSAKHFITNYFHVRHPNVGMIPFNALYPIQEKYIDHLTDDKSFLTLAARQVGHTNVTCGYILWSLLFERKSIALIASRRGDAMELMKIVQSAYDALPDFLKSKATTRNRSNLILENGGKLWASVSTECVLRGRILNTIVVVDGCRLTQRQLSWVWHGAVPSMISNNGKVVLTSSGKIPESEFAKLWDDPEFKVFKFLMPWDSAPLRDLKFKEAMIAKLGEAMWFTEFEVS